jgi:hypothetical protein
MKNKYFRIPFLPGSENLRLSPKQTELAGIFICVSVISVQNLIIFFRHYFLDYGFPWDFGQGYYAIVTYWTNLVSQGYIPSWIPYQQMGYPMSLLLQSGMHYPAFWIFPLFKIQYTLNAAVVFSVFMFAWHNWYVSFKIDFFKSNSYALLGHLRFNSWWFYSNSNMLILSDLVYAPAFLFLH